MKVLVNAEVDDRQRQRILASAQFAEVVFPVDVTPTEPLPAGHPLWRMPNVVITPHVAGASPYRLDRAIALSCENLQRYRAGQALRSVIDKRKGY